MNSGMHRFREDGKRDVERDLTVRGRPMNP